MIIRRKLFAKKDYDGLNFIARRKKRIERSKLAKELNEERNRINKDYQDEVQKDIDRANNAKNRYLSAVKEANTTGKDNRRYTREEKLNNAEHRKKLAKGYRDLWRDADDLLKGDIKQLKKDRNLLFNSENNVINSKKDLLNDNMKNLNSRINKKFKKAALIATPIVVGSAYGIKKLRDKKKK